MRSLHADLTAEQIATATTPYLRIHCEQGMGGATTYTYTTADATNKIKFVKVIEEPYSSHAIIVLSNQANDIPSLVGYIATIGFGYNTASGNKYEDVQPFWVKKQFQTSKMGSTDTVVYMEGIWNTLAEIQDIASIIYSAAGTAPYYKVDYSASAYSIYDVIGDVLEAAGCTIAPLGGEDDSIIDTLQPDFVVNSLNFEPAAMIIHRLMNMTKCMIRVGGGSGSSGRHPPHMGLIHTEPWDWLGASKPSWALTHTEPWSS